MPDGALDAGLDASVTPVDVGTRYDGDAPPRAGFCDAPDPRVVTDLPATVTVDTRLVDTDHARPSLACTSASDVVSADAVFAIDAPSAGIVTMRTDAAGTDPWVDAVLYARDGCAGDGMELGCVDGSAPRLVVEVADAGRVYAVLDGFSAVDRGVVEVTVDFVPVPPLTPAGSDLCADAREMTFSGTGDTRIARAEGDTTGLTSDDGCDDVPSTRDLPDQFYAFTLDEARDVAITLTPVGFHDEAFYVLSDCGATDAAACVDMGPPGYAESAFLEALPAGRYVLGVDAFAHPGSPEQESGPYTLEVVATRP